MIRLTENLWIGDSSAVKNMVALKIGAVLNVAVDLLLTVDGRPNVEYMKVGLVDGPGNLLSAYYTAVLAIATLLKRGKTLVCCHSGGRSLAVAVMYLQVVGGQDWDNWQRLLRILEERVEIDLPVINDAHKKMFDKVNWKLLRTLLEY